MNGLLVSLMLSLMVSQPLATPQDHSGLEFTRVEVKERVVTVSGDAAVRDLPESVTKPNPNTGRPINRPETEHERIERQTNQRIQNMHILQNAKLDTPVRGTTLPFYESRVEMRNNTGKMITDFVWAYRASDRLRYTDDQEFLCSVSIKPGEIKRLSVLSPSPRKKVVSVSASGTIVPVELPALKDIIVNQVKFDDGTTWQLPNWRPIVVSPQLAKKLGKGKCTAI